jgi:hypothetical protein
VPISDHDRKLLWGKAANRCAICQTPLSRPGTSRDPEAVIGDEAHIVGERSGSARHREISAELRDGYENRILLCPNDHRLIDCQPAEWTEARLLERKAQHEGLMRQRTDHGERSGLIFEVPPSDIRMQMLCSGKDVLDVIVGALAFQCTHDELQDQAERAAAADLLQSANDWGDIYDDIGPAGHIDAEAHLEDGLKAALESGLLLYGIRADTTVRFGDHRERWPVAYLHLRRAAPLVQQAREAA